MPETLELKVIGQIVDSHKIFRGNASRTAKQLGISKLSHARYDRYETPLDFFRAKKKYHGLTRTELSLTDPGLYRTLLRHGQLEKAIPGIAHVGRPSPTMKQINYVSRLHKKFDGNASRTAEFLGLSDNTVIRYWEIKGLKAKGKPGKSPLSQEEIQKIVQVYDKTREINETARLTGHNRNTVYKYALKKAY